MMNQTVILNSPSLAQETLDKIPPTKTQSGVDYHLLAGLVKLAEGKIDPAFTEFNLGLKFDPQNPHLHFLNALVYHQRAEAGDTTQFELAEIGYRLALKFEPTHWLAAYQLGKLYMGQNQFRQARNAFSEALLSEPDNPSIAYGLAAASYAAGRPQTARIALHRLPGPYWKNPAVMRASMLTEAALGNSDKSRQLLEEYRLSGAAQWRVKQIARRVASWEAVHASGNQQLAQSDSMNNDVTNGGMPADSGMGASTGEVVSEQLSPLSPANMVILDAIIISQEKTITSSTGVNLLSGLSLMFSGNLVDYARSRNKDYLDQTSSTSSQQVNNALTIALPSITYSLNIANAQDSNNKLLARPSVLAYNGSESEVFIGTELTYTTAGENSNSFTKEVGLTLRALPEFDEEGRLKITVYTEFDSIASTAAPGTFAQSVATVKSRSNVVAEVEFGKTLVIGAGSTKRTTKTENGVPVLKEIPILKNLFNVETDSDQEASLLILITPRKPAEVDFASGQIQNLIGNTGGAREDSPELAALRDRYKDWWRPTSNVLKSIHGLQSNKVLQEFRRGDIKFLDLDDNLSINGDTEAPGPRGLINTLVEHMYY